MTRIEKQIAIDMVDGWARYGDGALKSPRPDEFTLPMGKSCPYDPNDLKMAEVVDKALAKIGAAGRPGGRVYRLLVHLHRYGQPLDTFPIWLMVGGFDDHEQKRKLEEDREAERGLNAAMAGLGIVKADVLTTSLSRMYRRVFDEYVEARKNGGCPELVPDASLAALTQPAAEKKVKKGVAPKKRADV